jgi:hypothetical protein
MAHWQPQPRHILGLAAASLSLLLVQNAFGFPFRQTSANLRPRMLYHHLDSLVGVVLTGSSHLVDDLETLHELRQLALGASQAERSSVPVSLSSPTLVISSRGGLQLPGCSCAERSRGPKPSVWPPQYSFSVSPPLLKCGSAPRLHCERSGPRYCWACSVAEFVVKPPSNSILNSLTHLLLALTCGQSFAGATPL